MRIEVHLNRGCENCPLSTYDLGGDGEGQDRCTLTQAKLSETDLAYAAPASCPLREGPVEIVPAAP